jgi:hypothetical protein
MRSGKHKPRNNTKWCIGNCISRLKKLLGESYFIRLAVSAYDQEKRRLSVANDSAYGLKNRGIVVLIPAGQEIYFFSKTRQE